MGSIIRVENLNKEFKIYKRTTGVMGSIKSLFKRDYEIKQAIKGINFTIEEGEIVGYLGPNGAGKSTTIKILSGILSSTYGKVEVAGLDPLKDRIKNANNIGVVFGQRTQLWWDIPVIESINLMKDIYRISDEKFNLNLKLLREILELDEFINVPVRQLSLGQRMRADLCCALLHEPKVIFLDEPTIGLDIVVKKKIQEFIKHINKERKTTIILTTHDIDDIEKLCDRVIVIDKGEILYNGSIKNLKECYSQSGSVCFEICEGSDVDSLLLLKDKEIILDIIATKNNITFIYDKQKTTSSTIAKIVLNSCTVKDMFIKDNNLEDIIRKLYSDGCEKYD